MDPKVYVFDDHATFVCPKCENTKTVNVSQYKKASKEINVNCKCPCGHSHTAFLERRNYERKETTLSGIYSRLIDGKHMEKGKIVVTELSRSGLKFRPSVQTGFNIGDEVTISFSLTDDENSLIKKKIKIMNIHDDMDVGTEFITKETYGKIGAYLFG